MNRTTWIAAIFCSLAVLAGVSSCASREPATGEVGQGADGCGAWRFRGEANVDCRYQGLMSGNFESPTGMCINDSEIACTYPNLRCNWTFSEDQTVTACVDKREACSAYPPEANTFDPNPIIFTLLPGSTLCDPPASADALDGYCTIRRYDGYLRFSSQCQAQTERNMGSTTCCQPCAAPTPIPGANLAGTDGGIGGTDGGIGGTDGGIGGTDGGIGGMDGGIGTDAGTQCSGEDN